MPRLKTIDPATDTGPGADLLNGPLKQKQINIFKGMANNGPVLEAFVGFAGGVKNVLTPTEHEVIALVCGQKRNCEYCLSAHTAIGATVGIDEEHAIRIRQGSGDTPREQALVDFTGAIIDNNGWVTDEHVEAFRAAGFDDAAVVEVVAGIAVNTVTNFFNHINTTEVDFPVAATV